MSLAHNPSIATNGLIMYYDMNNTLKSWKGAPTTNVLTYTNLDTGWSQGYNTSIIIGDTSVGFPPGVNSQVVSFIDADSNGSGYWYSYGDYAPQADNTTYSVSVWAMTMGADWVIQPYTADNSESNRVWLTAKTVTGNGVWQRLEWPNAFTTGSGWDSDSLSFQFNTIPAGQRCWLCAPQMEPLSYCTPFVNGTRSSTQAIVDLTNRSTLTSASLTYNNNTFSFSESAGSTIVSTLPVGSTLPALSSFTLEAWVKVTAWPTNTTLNGYGQRDKAGTIVGGCYYAGTGIRWAGSSSGNSMYVFGFVRGADAYRNTATYNVPALNVYNHFVFTNNSPSGSMNLYVNGVLYSTVAAATQQYNPDLVSGCGNITINRADVDGGGTSVYSYLNGNIDAVKVYNRALTSAEVAQNFNAHRGRYGV